MIGDMLLGIVAICTLISYLPQIVKLIKTKKSDDISVGSWTLWVVSSLAYAGYAIFCSDDAMLAFTAILELSFCLIILIMTVAYQKKSSK